MKRDDPAGSSGSAITSVALISLAVLLAMGVWFGASALAPQIAAEWRLPAEAVSWLTLAVQLGFVAGTLLSATLNLPDVLSPRRLFASCAFLASAANAALVLLDGNLTTALVLRFACGAFLAGVYPPGMKLVATWIREGRGLALGVLVGALTLGKASPYLINTIGSDSWRPNILAASALALVAAGVVYFGVREGPYSLGRAPFDLRQVTSVVTDRGVRLASFGYFGHMWELYAMWTWFPVMMRASVELRGGSPTLAETASFLVIAAGAIGCVVAGRIADRVGRTIVTSAAMAISGACCIAVGPAFGGPSAVLLAIGLVWGATVVADSAQFSTCVTELADPRYVGTALTMQTCIGFLLTTVSITLLSAIVAIVGWKWAFVALAPGPFLGTLAMLRLRRLPEAARLAGGRG